MIKIIIGIMCLTFAVTNAFALEVAPTVSVNNQTVTVSWPSKGSNVEYYDAQVGSTWSPDTKKTSHIFTNVPFGTHSVRWGWCEKGEWIADEDENGDPIDSEYIEGECYSSAVSTIKLYRPTLSVSSPSNNYSFIDSSVTLSTNASDNGGSIKEVRYYLNSTYKGKKTTSSSSFNYGVIPTGTYTLKAIAYDKTGSHSLTQSRTVHVKKKPTISVSTSKTKFMANENVRLSASASDKDGSIKHIKYYLNGVLKYTGTATSYNFGILAPSSSYTLKAIAVDNDNLSSSASAKTISVVNNQPTLTINDPKNLIPLKQFVDNDLIIMDITAHDGDGTIANVETNLSSFYEGNSNALTSHHTQPATHHSSGNYSSNFGNIPVGYYRLTAVATDNLGKKVEKYVEIEVPPDTPIININYPISGGTIPQYNASQPVELEAEAKDTSGSVREVNFYLISADGTESLIETMTIPTTSKTDTLGDLYKFNYGVLPEGKHTLKAEAVNSMGSASRARELEVNVNYILPQLTASSFNGIHNDYEDLIINCVVSDEDSTNVTLKSYIDGVLFRSQLVDTTTPNSTSVNFGRITSGLHSLKIIATDSENKNSLPIELPVSVLGVRFIHTDILGSPIAETNGNGVVQ